MLATVGAVLTGAAYECAEDTRYLSSNPIDDCLRPMLNQVTSYLCSLAMSTTVSLASEAGAAKSNNPEHLEELWYRGPDFERFKHEVVSEARDAGYFSPETQYAHIKQKYIDETTRMNTYENVRRASVVAELDIDTMKGFHDSDAGADVGDTSVKTQDDTTTFIKDGPQHQKHHRRGHRRSVSFDMSQQPLLGLPPLTASSGH